MKNTLRIATVLSWINLIAGTGFVLCFFLGAVVMGMVAVVGAILVCAIPLNSYAALQLHKSIRRPEVKLSHHTPAGIRFVGFVALFLGLLFVGNDASILLHPAALTESMRLSAEQMGLKETPQASLSLVRWFVGFALALGLAVVINVLLNLRLLRWYYLVRQSDAS